MSFNLKDLLDQISDASQDLAALSELGQHLAKHREELTTALRTGAIEKARAVVRQMCEDCPPAVGVINYLMTSDVDSAIGAIGMYDAPLSESLRTCRGNFTALQQSWSSQIMSRESGAGSQ